MCKRINTSGLQVKPRRRYAPDYWVHSKYVDLSMRDKSFLHEAHKDRQYATKHRL
jgi:hypothetical protein